MNCAALALVLHLASYHTAPGYNNNTPGVGLQCDAVAVGVYRNSFDKTSVYAAYSIQTEGVVRVGATGGLATGYSTAIKPIGGVFVAGDVGRFTLTTLLAPTHEKHGAVFHFTLSARL